MKLKSRPIATLTFDIENRPLSYWYDGNCTAEVTAIAWSWGDPDAITTFLLGKHSAGTMLGSFRTAWNMADLVTGHYIRRHDIPILNGALMEAGIPTLDKKLTCDTRLDLINRKDIPASQEALSDMLGITEPKIQMSQAQWRESNRLTKFGLQLTRRRVEGDIRQHLAMKAELSRLGWLSEPKEWRP